MPSPRDVALAYDLHLAALWRGEERDARRFDAWLAAHRCNVCPPEPAGLPAQVSPLGAGGLGIRWYADGDVVLGFAPGLRSECYRVTGIEALPASASVPAFALAGIEEIGL